MSDSTQKTLDECYSRLKEPLDNVAQTVASLAKSLREIKQEVSLGQWETTIQQCRLHPLCSLLHQDPLTERAFRKPRGYQGDAELLDIIYNKDWRGIRNDPVTELGQTIFDFTVSCKAPAAVRTRRDILSKEIDDV